MNKRLRGSLLLLLAALVWGMAFAAQSSAMDSVQPFTFNGGRSVITALALGLILLMAGNLITIIWGAELLYMIAGTAIYFLGGFIVMLATLRNSIIL